MTHTDARKEFQKVVAPKVVAAWFIRHQLFALGYYDEAGSRVELARGDGTTPRGVKAILREATRRFRSGK